MLRKLIIKPQTATPDATTGEIDIATVCHSAGDLRGSRASH